MVAHRPESFRLPVDIPMMLDDGKSDSHKEIDGDRGADTNGRARA